MESSGTKVMKTVTIAWSLLVLKNYYMESSGTKVMKIVTIAWSLLVLKL